MSAASASPEIRPQSPAPLAALTLPTFERLAARRDEEIDAAMGAALIARDAYPRLDVIGLLARFDEIAEPLAHANLPSLPPLAQAREIGNHLYGALGFKGNETEYYDPKNSLLPDVLDRKLGIPISLALVFTEVATRLGVSARGVSFPGHFLVRIDATASTIDVLGDDPDARTVFVDPFFGGRILSRDALVRLLRRSTGPAEELKDDHLAPASSRSILVRMLINLKWIYMTRGDFARAHLALDRIVSLTPEAPAALRERGLLAARLGAVEAARADLARLLELHPDLADAKVLRARLEELKATKRAPN